MPAETYRIWAWGPEVDASSTGARRIGIAGIAKPSSTEFPFQVPNEIICTDIGRAIRLPIPPGCVVTHESGKVVHYVSLDFSQSAELLPPIDARALARDFPELACGIILFDLWMANEDRHEANLSYDTDTKTIQIFDHGRAILSAGGRSRLEKIDDRKIIDSNCLSGEIRNMSGFSVWNNRIKSIPKFFIEEVVSDAKKFGFPEDEVKFCTDFLLDRRSKLMRLVKKHKAIFHNVTQEDLPGITA